MSQNSLPSSSQTPDIFDTGASVVISHKVSQANTVIYEKWLVKIRDTVMQAQGFLDSHIIHPIAGLNDTYTVILRFATVTHLNAWMSSKTRKKLIEEITPILLGEEDFHINSGLEFLFPVPSVATPPQPPKRWKQFLLTWSAIFPLVSIMSWLVLAILDALHLTLPHLLVTLIVTALVVYLMVYIVMPRYTRLVQNWLKA